jgi:Transglycosylase SLT domain
VNEAASYYHLSPEILWGVYGIETSHGTDVKTSSTGAMGSYQFEPETARQYGYPLSNSKDRKTFRTQTFAAAHYLSDIMKGGRRTPQNYNRALKIYNSGRPTAGYGFHEVRARGSSWAAVMKGGAYNQYEKELGYGSVGATVGEVVEGKNPISTTAGFIEALSEPHTWVRFVEVVGGFVLLYIGLHSMIQATRPTVVGEAAGEVNKATLKLKGTTAAVATGGLSKTAKVAEKAVSGKKRVSAAKAAHSRSLKFGGTKAQARKAALNAGKQNPKSGGK